MSNMWNGWVGRTVAAKYTILGVLGEGGMGVVFRARHVDLGNEVALKVLQPDLRMSGAIRQRFATEGRALASLDHPGIVRVLDAGKAEGDTPYIVMELLKGESVRQRLETRGPIPFEHIKRIGAEALAALHVAHDRQFVHRDIKPDNLFLTEPADRVKILDFGIAKIVADNGFKSTGPTRMDSILGTIAYMSPEQIDGPTDVKATADLWSLGITLYEMATGRVPFSLEGGRSAFRKSQEGPLPPLTPVAGAFPGAFVELLRRALAQAPNDRFKSALEMREALQGIAVPDAPAAPATLDDAAPGAASAGGPVERLRGATVPGVPLQLAETTPEPAEKESSTDPSSLAPPPMGRAEPSMFATTDPSGPADSTGVDDSEWRSIPEMGPTPEPSPALPLELVATEASPWDGGATDPQVGPEASSRHSGPAGPAAPLGAPDAGLAAAGTPRGIPASAPLRAAEHPERPPAQEASPEPAPKGPDAHGKETPAEPTRRSDSATKRSGAASHETRAPPRRTSDVPRAVAVGVGIVVTLVIAIIAARSKTINEETATTTTEPPPLTTAPTPTSLPEPTAGTTTPTSAASTTTTAVMWSGPCSTPAIPYGKWCGQCVAPAPANGCRAPTCEACPDLANATETCRPWGPGSGPACIMGGCESGYDDCDREMENGCEADLTSEETCGGCLNSCGIRANADHRCEAGKCKMTCHAGFDDCNKAAQDGCEADLKSPGTCGACNVRCESRTNARHECEDQHCKMTCNKGSDDCDKNPQNGCESVNTPERCGDCQTVCPVGAHATAACVDGTCRLTCEGAYRDCTPEPGCETNSAVNEMHCGDCNKPCKKPEGGLSAQCQGGLCLQSCPPTAELKGDRCEPKVVPPPPPDPNAPVPNAGPPPGGGASHDAGN